MSSMIKVVIAVIAVVVIAGGVWLLTSSKTAESPSAPASQSSKKNNETATVTITYADEGFSPSNLTVKSGQAIKVVNSSSKEMEFASNQHPVHTDNPELNAGDIAPNESKTFTLTTTGEWGFHNHYDAGKGGTVKVE